ncbi:two-component system sensor histidine kinase NtrB [Pyxidicoccus xibeiensis]|uniref:two-component system sensor histidine kinase NtrB n=1 Tax=Pyxidicoccus xibeiensis TaxID=2906759 RepID=UPI0020A8196F|nr:ATP-binding protein [Pyxidicoccus xibeiensis]MCP3143988.1 ATP-binding protein [Pyxidicoccus xibeiensis]
MPAPSSSSHPAGGRGPSHPEELRRKLTWLIAFRLVATSLSLVAIVLRLLAQTPAEPDRGDWFAFSIIGFIYLLSLVTAVAVRRGRWTLPAVITQVLGDLVIATVLVVLTGGGDSPFTFTYSLAVISGAILLERRGALALAAAGSVIYAGVVLGLYEGLGEPVLSRRAPFLLVSHVLALFLVAVLAGYLSRQLSAAGGALSAKEKDLHRLETLQAQILACMPSGLVTCDAKGQVTFVNHAAGAILGIDVEKGRERMLEELLPGALHLGRRTSRRELTVRTPAGERILGLSTTPLEDEREGALLIVFQDLTELRRMEDGLRRADRLAALGTMSAQLAHEIRNPLAAMKGSAQLLGQDRTADAATVKLTGVLVREADRLSRLVEDFLRFARPPTPSRREVRLDQLVAETMEMLRGDPLARDVRLEVGTGEAPVDVRVDPDQLQQVLLNLARNALQATGAQGLVRVEVARSDGEVVLKVWNSGAPIPRTDLPRLFEPFFTTREGGTGLGLASAHSIIRAHGGDIRVHSEEGAGTEFAVILPVQAAGSPGSSLSGPVPPEPTPAPGGPRGEQPGVDVVTALSRVH